MEEERFACDEQKLIASCGSAYKKPASMGKNEGVRLGRMS